MEGSTPTEITFSDAYDELKNITEELNGADTIPPERLLDLLKRGKGLEQVLRQHLDDVEQQVRSIEAGDGLAQYRIVTGAAGVNDDPFVWDEPSSASAPAAGQSIPGNASDFVPSALPSGVADDNIPF